MARNTYMQAELEEPLRTKMATKIAGKNNPSSRQDESLCYLRETIITELHDPDFRKSASCGKVTGAVT